MTGPLVNKTIPLVLRVDSDTNIPYALAEATNLTLGGTFQVGTLSATTYSSLALSGLGDVSSNISPSAGQALIWDGGVGKWTAGTVGGGGGGGSPGGPVESVQFKSNTGGFDGETEFSYSKTTNTLSVEKLDTIQTISFDTGITNSYAVGDIGWNTKYNTLDIKNSTGTTIQVGQDSVIHIINGTGSTISRGNVVSINGVDPSSKLPTVVLACASAANTNSGYLIGLATENIIAGDSGFMTTFGVVDNVSAPYTEGTLIYLSNTSGQFTDTKPSKPAHNSYTLGRVLKQDAAGNGTVFVTIRGYSDINELHDVATTTPTNGQVLVYNSTTQLYEPNQTSSIAGISNYATTASLANYATTASLSNYLQTTSIGTTVQAFDTTLNSIASLIPPANSMIYFSATDAAASASLTSYGRSLLSSTDATGARTTLGLGSLATQNPSLVGSNQVLFINGGSVSSTATPADATFLKYTTASGLHFTAVGGSVSYPITVTQGGTNKSTAPTTNGSIMYFNNSTTAFDTTNTFYFTTGTGTLVTPVLNLTTALGTAYGGTGQTSLGSVNVNSFAGTGVFATTASIGVTIQAYDATLNSIAALSPPTDSMIYFTNTDTAATATISSYGRSLVSGVDAATARTTLGLGSVATQNTVAIANGGTNATSFNTNRVPYFDGTRFVDSVNLTFNGTTVSATNLSATTLSATTVSGNNLYLANPLATLYGGTGQTSLANVNVTSFAGTGVFATTASLASYATTASLASYETTAYARANYALTSTSLTAFPGTLTIAKGGTGVTTLSNNALLYVTGTSVTSVVAPTDGNYLKYTTAGGYSWATPAGGGATWSSVFKTADQTVTGTTLANDNTLSCTISANSKYVYRLVVPFQTNAAGGVGFGISCTGVSPIGTYCASFFDPIDLTLYPYGGSLSWDTGALPTVGDGESVLKVDGVIDNSTGSATTFNFKFSAGATSKTAMVRAGAYLEYYKVS